MPKFMTLLMLLAAFTLFGCETSKADEAAKGKDAQPGSVEKAEQAAKAGGTDIKLAPGKELIALFETSMGTIKIKLFPDKAPKTVKNFVELARGQKEWVDPKTLQKVTRPLYDGTIFHRVIPKFMIQGGDPKANGTGGPGYRFEDEFDPSLKFDRPGLLAMANSGPNTNGSQFFITEEPTPWLTGKHTIFGEVIEGMDIVNNIARVPRNNRDKPNEDVVLKKVTIVEQDAAK